MSREGVKDECLSPNQLRKPPMRSALTGKTRTLTPIGMDEATFHALGRRKHDLWHSMTRQQRAVEAGLEEAVLALFPETPTEAGVFTTRLSL